jgi:hypothetical protein
MLGNHAVTSTEMICIGLLVPEFFYPPVSSLCSPAVLAGLSLVSLVAKLPNTLTKKKLK